MSFFDKFKRNIKNEEGGASEQLETNRPVPDEYNDQCQKVKNY